MDDLSIQGPELERTLYEIEFINRTLGGYGPTFEGVQRLLPAGQDEVSVLDVGTGSGDIPRRLVDWGRRRGIRVHVTGIDLTETAVAMAQRTSSAYDSVEFKVQDLFDLPDVPSFDVVHAAATLHHFVGEDAQRALAKMYRVARLGVVINDFHRH
ncbi:MAG: methyltransferase domain-containing protein, partial [Myxococcota bacterium]